jgi:hypothetical protein
MCGGVAGRLVRDIVRALVARMTNSDDRHVVSLCAWVVAQQQLPLRVVEDTDPGTLRALFQVCDCVWVVPAPSVEALDTKEGINTRLALLVHCSPAHVSCRPQHRYLGGVPGEHSPPLLAVPASPTRRHWRTS